MSVPDDCHITIQARLREKPVDGIPRVSGRAFPSWSTPPIAPTGESAAPRTNGSQVTALVTVPLGRHSPHSEPTGELVKDMWETTELHAPSLLDWTPDAFGTKHLGRRRFRWPMVLSLVAILLAVVGSPTGSIRTGEFRSSRTRRRSVAGGSPRDRYR